MSDSRSGVGRSTALRRAAREKAGSGQLAEALQVADKACELDPQSDENFKVRADIKRQLPGKLAEALQDADKACELGPQFSGNFMVRALIKRQLPGKLAEALQDADKACELGPQWHSNFIVRALIKRQLPEKLSEALQDADKACELGPQWHSNFIVRALIKRQLPEKLSEALQDADKACELDPQCDDNFRTRAEIERSLRQHVVIVGAGPVGLSLALGLARERPDLLSITLVERRVEQSQAGSWYFSGLRRDQVVTLQDSVIAYFENEGTDVSTRVFNGERVWKSSRNCAIMELEDRLLQRFEHESQQRTGMQLVVPSDSDRQNWLAYLQGLKADIIVAADGARSSTRDLSGARAAGFERIFVSDNPGNEEHVPCVDCDYTLGVGPLAFSAERNM